MNPVRFWFAVFALLGIVIVAPAWMYWTGEPLDGLPVHVQFLVSLMLPMMILLTLASWLQSG